MKLNTFRIVITIAAILSTNLAAQASQIDERIVASAKNSYVFKTYLKDDSITMKSTDGNVVLSGTVSEANHKALAYETVASLPGVKRVDSELTLKGEEPSENSDGWISMQVKYSLLYNRHVSGIKTQVFVKDGLVTLQGEAQNQAQKDLAGEYARDIKGVTAINNQMTVAKVLTEPKATIGEKIDDASITAQVKMALLAHRSTSAFKTSVETTNGVVTLGGTANNNAEKEMVSKLANDINGVTKVINKMTLEQEQAKR